MNEPWTEPTVDNVRKAGAEFDSWKDNPDPALAILFAQYPANTCFDHVLLKVVVVNSTYGTQIHAVSSKKPTLYDVARHIVSRNIDDALQAGSVDVVDRIADVSADGKHEYLYSFASKYCNWQRPDCYPIYDARVVKYLCALRSHEANQPGGFRQFETKELWSYPTFKQVVADFREHFHLQEFSFKEIDKFLYVEGMNLFLSENAPAPGADHLIQKPAA
ncbi:MAG TPA: hypothetical protein VLZ50_05530 [Terracidiphilus sp.]|nr:hypothetical protein [Terracidiphilus sp.]